MYQAADLTTSMPWIVCCANIACPFGHTVRGVFHKKRPGPIVTHVYLVGRSATSGQAIRKILPPDVPKVVLIGLPTRIVAAGIPHYTTINSMWSEVDVLLTANPDLLLNYPEDKKIIKFNSTYNKDIKTELSVSFIKQLNEVINKL